VATISINLPADSVEDDDRMRSQSPPSCTVRSRGWLAVDVVAEAELEAQINFKPSFRRALFGWLIEFNRY
jgi:hypothetical protein